MICYIYRSRVKTEMYLYTTSKDDFTMLPEQLLRVFGRPEFSMLINLDKREHLARVDIEKVKHQIEEDGYYLQMPPSILTDQNFLNPEQS